MKKKDKTVTRPSTMEAEMKSHFKEGAAAKSNYFLVDVDQIIVEERERDLDQKAVDEIAASLPEMGLLQPIGLKILPGSLPRYQLVFGAHRLAAWKQVRASGREGSKAHEERWKEIPATWLLSGMTDEMFKVIELRENLFRSDLSAEQRKSHAMKLGELMQTKVTKEVPVKAKPSATSANGTSSKPGPKKGWFATWYESAKTPKKTATNWWKQYTDANDITCTPNKADAEMRAAFFAWHKEMLDNPPAKPETKPAATSTPSQASQEPPPAPAGSIECDPKTGEPVNAASPKDQVGNDGGHADFDEAVDAALTGASKTAAKKIKTKIIDVVTQLEADYREAVSEGVEKERQRFRDLSKEAKKQEQNWLRLSKNVVQHMTLKEFRLVRGLLHSDKHEHEDAATRKKYEKAFEIFNRLEATVPPNLSKAEKEKRGWTGHTPRKTT